MSYVISLKLFLKVNFYPSSFYFYLVIIVNSDTFFIEFKASPRNPKVLISYKLLKSNNFEVDPLDAIFYKSI